MKSIILKDLYRILLTILFILAYSFSHSQNSILLHINPLYAADVNPASTGLGFEHSFKKMSIGFSVLYTYMEFIESDYDQGTHSGYRLIADIRFPTKNPALFYNIFPTYWRSEKIKGTENGTVNYYNYKNRTKYGLGIGFIKVFKATRKINFDLTFGLELNNVVRERIYYDLNTSQYISDFTNSLLPRLRSDFRMRFRL
ncbi:MAG: hypothetical protein IPH57_02510 [Saprospiraceae bacterium]|nr:hypothetical protein [Saprospiraceae bacterium]